MKNKLMLMSAVVAGTVAFLAPQIAKADTIVLDNGMPLMDTTPVILNNDVQTIPVVEPTYMTAPIAPVVAPDFYSVQRDHFLNLGIGNLFHLGLL